MIEIAFSSSFKRAFKKISKNKPVEKKFWEKTTLFINEPFHPYLKTHSLSGRLEELWSSIQYVLRVIFYFTDKSHALFIDIGTHDKVY